MEIVPIPELHIMLGVVNWLYDLLENHFADAKKWYQHFHLTRSPYHGEKFEGNACHRLLQTDSLDELLVRLQRSNIDHNSLPFRVHKSMCAFRDLRHACFSKLLLPDFEDRIKTFEESIAALNRRRITTKVSTRTSFACDCDMFFTRSFSFFVSPSLSFSCSLFLSSLFPSFNKFCVLSRPDPLHYRSSC